ncbi:enoyl-CoA hydratase/isomerase family protein [Acrocarpospora catenulata]|uniref:enoyl-CoA hydratase/isomerase family protein n=1 Tax=Acrocarpospora catenulata TaxID=2836182 RepID=UPI001BDAB965|nr:enoyl-CoA hydratase/isomerase family protein [Acrocarpospora catenulata]
MSERQRVRTHLADGVLTITLDRPEARNALDQRMRTELLAALADDPAVRVVVLRGHPTAFCAGADLKEAGRVDPEVLLARGKKIMTALTDLPKPVVCVVRGHCAGAGISIALACDLVVADETALFTPAFLAAGLVPDMGITHLLVRHAGLLRAKDILLTGRRLSAAEAAELGLVSRVWPSEELERRLGELTRQLAALPAAAAAWTRKLSNRSFELDLASAYDAETSAALLVIEKAGGVTQRPPAQAGDKPTDR